MEEDRTSSVGDLDPQAFRGAVLAWVNGLLSNKKFQAWYDTRARGLIQLGIFNGLEIRSRFNLAFTPADEARLQESPLAYKMFLEMKDELAHASGMSARSPDELEREISSMLQIVIGTELLRLTESITPWQ